MTRFDEPSGLPHPALQRLRAQPALFVVSTIATCLMFCLAIAVLVADQAARDALVGAAGDIRLSVFLSPQLTRPEAEALRSRIESASVVRGATLRTREDAWSAMGAGGVPNLANRPNPLPDVWLVTLRLPGVEASRPSLAADVDSARSAIAAIAGVDTVSYDRSWVGLVERWSTAARWLSAARWLATGLIATMVFCVFFLAGRAHAGKGGPSTSSAAALTLLLVVAGAATLASIASYGSLSAMPLEAMQLLVAAAGHIGVPTWIETGVLLVASATIGNWAGAR